MCVPAVDPRALTMPRQSLPKRSARPRTKAEIASDILACAAKGERDPVVLKMAALSASVECTHYSHDMPTDQISWFRKLDGRINLLFLMAKATLALNVASLVAIYSAR